MIKVFVIIGFFLACLVVMTFVFTVGFGVCAWAFGCEKTFLKAIKKAFKRLSW